MRVPYTYTMPEAFIRDEGVPARWRLWAYLNGFFINGKTVWASNKTISEEIGCHENTVTIAVSDLETMGYITCERTKRSRVISMVVDRETPVNTYLRPLSTPVSDPYQQGTTSDSNSDITSRVAKKAPRSQFGKYNETQTSDSYEPVIDADSGEEVSPAKAEKNPQLRKQMMTLIHWAEDRRGGKFVSIPKQILAINKMKNIGVEPDDIKNRWVDMESDPYWKEKGFDFVNVASSFDRKPT